MKKWMPVMVVACMLSVFFLAACDDDGGDGSETLWRAPLNVPPNNQMVWTTKVTAPRNGEVSATVDWKEGGTISARLVAETTGEHLIVDSTAPITMSRRAPSNSVWYVRLMTADTSSKNASVTISFTPD
ncbi:MAG: hypothetical protein KKC51_03530 [Verrucomicrobia bacterium]|nr:hypothetical protein [Verrucomicrobiota bacterium]